MSKHYIIGVFGDEEPLLEAVKEVRASGTRIHEVYTPFPVHGLDELLGYKRSRLPKAAFMFGCLGFTLAITMQTWMLGIDWPMNIGGKPALAWPFCSRFLRTYRPHHSSGHGGYLSGGM